MFNKNFAQMVNKICDGLYNSLSTNITNLRSEDQNTIAGKLKNMKNKKKVTKMKLINYRIKDMENEYFFGEIGKMNLSDSLNHLICVEYVELIKSSLYYILQTHICGE